MPIVACMQVPSVTASDQQVHVVDLNSQVSRCLSPRDTLCGMHTLLAVSGSSTPPIDFSGAATFCTSTRSSSGMRRLDMSEPGRTVPLVGLQRLLQIHAHDAGARVRRHSKEGEGGACACPWTFASSWLAEHLCMAQL